MKVFLRQKWWLVTLAIVLIIAGITAAVLFSRSKQVPTGPSGPLPFEAGTSAVYPYDFTGDPSGWTVEEAAIKAATYSGAEYIIIQDANSKNIDTTPILGERLSQIVSERNCLTVNVDGSTRYIILPEDISAVKEG